MLNTKLISLFAVTLVLYGQTPVEVKRKLPNPTGVDQNGKTFVDVFDFDANVKALQQTGEARRSMA
jgi:hypothetical protein